MASHKRTRTSTTKSTSAPGRRAEVMAREATLELGAAVITLSLSFAVLAITSLFMTALVIALVVILLAGFLSEGEFTGERWLCLMAWPFWFKI